MTSQCSLLLDLCREVKDWVPNILLLTQCLVRCPLLYSPQPQMPPLQVAGPRKLLNNLCFADTEQRLSFRVTRHSLRGESHGFFYLGSFVGITSFFWELSSLFCVPSQSFSRSLAPLDVDSGHSNSCGAASPYNPLSPLQTPTQTVSWTQDTAHWTLDQDIMFINHH